MASSRVCSGEAHPDRRRIVVCCVAGLCDVFVDDVGDLGKTDNIQHTINTRGAQPIRQTAHCLPAAQHEEVRKLLREMEEKRIIWPSRSPWALPVVLVKKNNGST